MIDTSQNALRLLLKAIRRGKKAVIPFVGAGLSVYGYDNDRLPLWHELMETLIAHADAVVGISSEDQHFLISSINNREYLIALERLVDVMGEGQFRIVIEQMLDTEEREIPPAIMLLVCVSWSLIVTTNLDRFIEQAWAKRYGSSLKVITHRDGENFARAVAGTEPGSILLKTHGTLERFDTWILTQTQYRNLLLQTLSYTHSMSELYKKALLFVGYGMTDEDFEPIIEHLKRNVGQGIDEYYAILDKRRRQDPTVIRLIREYNVLPIWYDFDELRSQEKDRGHGEVYEYLKLIVREWLVTNRPTPIVTHYIPELNAGFVGRHSELREINRFFTNPMDNLLQIVGFGGEGKTSLVQKWLSDNIDVITESSFDYVFGHSFYKGSIADFISHLYNLLQFRKGANSFLGVPEKVSEIKAELRDKRLVLILDGFEAVQTPDGEIDNPFVEEVMNAALTGGSKVMVTTRLGLKQSSRTINLEGLSTADALECLIGISGWQNTDRLGWVIENKVGTHALSLTVFGSFLRMIKGQDIDLGAVSLSRDITDEADPRIANKAKRVLDFYDRFLGQDPQLAMAVFSCFRRPTPEAWLHELFKSLRLDPDTPGDIAVVDIEASLDFLRETRFLIPDSEGDLTTHPLLRNHFNEKLSGESSGIVHRHLTELFLKNCPAQSPETMADAIPLIEACYHAAKSGQWQVFSDLFRDRINRGAKFELGYRIGAWNEMLNTARLAFPDGDLQQPPMADPAHVNEAVALSFRRLGRSTKALRQYYMAVQSAMIDGDKQVVRPINNMLYVNMMMGRIPQAIELMTHNLATLHKLEMDWFRYWQIEHAYLSFGRLAMLAGRLDAAQDYFNYAENMRKSPDYDAESIHSLVRISLSDFYLHSSPAQIYEARRIAEDNLRIGHSHDWRDIVTGGQRALAEVMIRESETADRPNTLIDDALRMLDQALAAALNRSHFELQIEIRLARAAAWLTSGAEYAPDLAMPELKEVGRLIDSTEQRVFLPMKLLVEARAHRAVGRDEAFRTTVERATRYVIENGCLFFFVAPSCPLKGYLEELGISQPKIVLPELPQVGSEEHFKMDDATLLKGLEGLVP